MWRADWIGPRLAPFDSGEVTSVVPDGFESYARILHPCPDTDGGTVRWSRVAQWSGIPLRPGMQFTEIAFPEHTPDGPVPCDHGPVEGTLPRGDAAALTAPLAAHTSTPGTCWFCVWDGFGWDNWVPLTFGDGDAPALPPFRDPVPSEVRDGPRVRLPHRDYFLYGGPASDVVALADAVDQTPNLWWPEDRAWCAGTDIDLPVTYLGGSADLIAAVLADDRIEAQPARPHEEDHHLRGPAWLADRIDEAVSELLLDGRTRVDTVHGSTHAHLENRPDGAQRLAVRYSRGNGSAGIGGTFVRTTDDEERRRQIHHQLTFSVLGLIHF